MTEVIAKRLPITLKMSFHRFSLHLILNQQPSRYVYDFGLISTSSGWKYLTYANQEDAIFPNRGFRSAVASSGRNLQIVDLESAAILLADTDLNRAEETMKDEIDKENDRTEPAFDDNRRL